MRKAFTLIEVLVVVAIIGIISGLSIFGIKDARANARDSVRKSNMELISSALELYKLDCNVYPTALPSPGQPLVGSGASSRCKNTNTYIAAMPADPQGPARYYNYYSDSEVFDLCASLEKGTGTVSCGGSTVCGSQTSERGPVLGDVVLAQEQTDPTPGNDPNCTPSPTPNSCSGQQEGAVCIKTSGGCGSCWVGACTVPVGAAFGTCQSGNCTTPILCTGQADGSNCLINNPSCPRGGPKYYGVCQSGVCTEPSTYNFCSGKTDGTSCSISGCANPIVGTCYSACTQPDQIGTCQNQQCSIGGTIPPATPTPAPYTCNYKVSNQ